MDRKLDIAYHGGTNFGRFASSYVTTSYYDGAPLDEYGLIWQPTWAHLRELHAAVKQSAEPLLWGEYSNHSFGPQQEGHVFATESECVAFLDSGAYMERRSFGVLRVSIKRRQQKPHSMNNEHWKHQVGLSGETNKIYTSEGSSRAEWTTIDKSMYLPLIWYKTTFDTPWGNDPVTLNLSSMRKGEVWINGESIGRYWVSFKTPSGQPSQPMYHIPRFFLKTGENLLVLMEEIGGDPLQITVNTMSVTRIYGSVSEFSTPSLLSRDNHPAVHLRCQKGKHITDVEFASYGNPVEDCRGSGRSCQGSCHAEMSEFIVKNACLGRRKCVVPVRAAKFGGDPCPGIPKFLSVVAICG
nr:unnamed protein product [Digitaria exilis]